MKVLFVMGVLFLALSACATVSYNYVPETRLQGSPPIGEVRTVSIGESLLTQGVVTTFDVIEVPKATKVSVIVVGKGTYRKVGSEGPFEYYGTDSDARAGKFGGSANIYHSITIRIETTTGSTCFIGDGLKMCPTPPVKLEFTRATGTSQAPTELQQTLLYNGKVGNKLNIGYREFRGDLARPAFSNEVEYDLNESPVIGYKGAALEVIQATNRSITYKVLSNFR